MAGAQAYDRDDPTFVEDLEHSDDAVIRVALWMRRTWGRHVHIPPLRVRPAAEEMADFSDAGDLFTSRDGKAWDRIEVSVRGLAFKSRADYPYPTVIVCSVHAWNKADPRPTAYVRLNRAMTHAAVIVTAKSSDRWTAGILHDVMKKRDRGVFYCPKELVNFIEMKGL